MLYGWTGLQVGPGSVMRAWGPDLDGVGRSGKELREKGPPRVLEPLKDLVLLMEGSAAKLICCVSAFSDLFTHWGKDRKELRDRPKCRYVFKDPDIVALVVHDGELADLNQYSINVTNPFGQCSGSARILVEGTTRPWGQCHRTEYQLAGAHSLVLLRLPLGLPESAWGCGPAPAQPEPQTRAQRRPCAYSFPTLRIPSHPA